MLLNATTILPIGPARDEWAWCCRSARAPVIRTMRQFALDELRITKGQYEGRRYRIYRQPSQGLLLDAMDDPRWRRRAVCECVQKGKTLMGFVVPVLYHLFELRDDVIAAGPTIHGVLDKKWYDELLPAIERTHYRHFLPITGPASRGGFSEEIHFTNGARLIFLSSGGGDETKSSVTARIIAVTEVDKCDTASDTSRETDPIGQFEARASSYPKDRRIVYLECTVSIPEGRIWQEVIKGTNSRIVCPCPHCRRYVAPGRDHLQGWHSAETAREAERLAFFVCPQCGEALSADQRVAMNAAGVLLHEGQEIDPAGTITGEPKDTDTLGFHSSAFHNLFWTPGEIAAKEWEKLRAVDEESKEKELAQFYWATPYEPPDLDVRPLDADQLRRRMADRRWTKAVVPEDCEHLVAAADVHKRLLWWLVMAWRPEARAHVVDYGTLEVPSDDMTLERAIRVGLDELQELMLTGFCAPDGTIVTPEQVWVDAGYHGDVVMPFCRVTENRFRPAKGCGLGKHYAQGYTHPKAVSKTVRFIGDEYNIRWSNDQAVHYVLVNADPWRSFLHERCRTPQGEPGSLVAYHSSDPNEHIRLAKHFTAEHPVAEFIPGKGEIVRWERKSRNNHLLDCGYNACAAAHFCGVRVVSVPARAATRRPKPGVRASGVTMPDGRPFLVTER